MPRRKISEGRGVMGTADGSDIMGIGNKRYSGHIGTQVPLAQDIRCFSYKYVYDAFSHLGSFETTISLQKNN